MEDVHIEDIYLQAHRLLDKEDTPPGELAARIVDYLGNAHASYYPEMHKLVAVVNDCLNRISTAAGVTRDHCDDPAFELSDSIEAIISTIAKQADKLNQLQSVLGGQYTPTVNSTEGPTVGRGVSPESLSQSALPKTYIPDAGDPAIGVGRMSDRPEQDELPAQNELQMPTDMPSGFGG